MLPIDVHRSLYLLKHVHGYGFCSNSKFHCLLVSVYQWRSRCLQWLQMLEYSAIECVHINDICSMPQHLHCHLSLAIFTEAILMKIYLWPWLSFSHRSHSDRCDKRCHLCDLGKLTFSMTSICCTSFHDCQFPQLTCQFFWPCFLCSSVV